MSLGRRQVPTAPEIRDALSGLSEVVPQPRAVTDAALRENFPASGAVPIGNDDVVKLPFSLGDVIAGKYEIVGLIGAGGVGYVVSAMHLELGEMVALKFLREESLVHEEVVARFAREARAAAKIKSEYVARVFDVGSLPNGVPFIVMEYLHGKDLADVVRQEGRLPIKVAVEYVMQACEALASAHSMGTVHRDIKPENLFLTRHAEGVEIIKVLDFGISKVALQGGASQSQRQFVKTMMPMGTPAYMSPEQIRATGEVDARTDIWALGCVLFELLTASCVFDAPTLMQLGAAILERAPVPLRQILPDAPPELEAIILRCLEKDASKRYQTVAELAVALYPFAPRRARISAERSSYLLHSTNPNIAPLELSSVAPPPIESSTRLTPGRGAELAPGSPTGGLNHADLRAMRPNRLPYFFAAGIALALGGAFLFLRGGDAGSTKSDPVAAGKPATPVAAAQVAPAQAPAAAARAEAASAPQAAPAPASANAGSVPSDGSASSANSAKGKALPKAMRLRPRAPGAPRPPGAARGDDEFDVGY
ncbi:MAG TPA: serine/threonine-protein kinase [Polyangiaceae bacterium]|nr:serine/threonine-protein kinase [Polyangiaceae bacterium]